MDILNGTAHKVPNDFKKALTSSSKLKESWNNLTPLARNEWICWIESVEKKETRNQHIKRAVEELKEGKRRPCCWYGCTHRKDKPLSASQKFVLSKKRKI